MTFLSPAPLPTQVSLPGMFSPFSCPSFKSSHRKFPDLCFSALVSLPSLFCFSCAFLCQMTIHFAFTHLPSKPPGQPLSLPNPPFTPSKSHPQSHSVPSIVLEGLSLQTKSDVFLALQGPEMVPYLEAQLKEQPCSAYREINGRVLCYICTFPPPLPMVPRGGLNT